MTGVVSFRPDAEELKMLEATRRTLGLDTMADAVRHLLRRGHEAQGSLRDDPILRFRVPGGSKKQGKSFTSKEIDDAVYGGMGR